MRRIIVVMVLLLIGLMLVGGCVSFEPAPLAVSDGREPPVEAEEASSGLLHEELPKETEDEEVGMDDPSQFLILEDIGNMDY